MVFEGVASAYIRREICQASRPCRGQIPTSDRIEAEYEFPYLAHAPMDPINLTVRNDKDRAEAWVPSQIPTWEQAALAEVLGLKPEQVTFHVLSAGGSFGRRGTTDSHFVREAAAVYRVLIAQPDCDIARR
jgi:isoquinoline 1-oxidoreductase beta subunit